MTNNGDGAPTIEGPLAALDRGTWRPTGIGKEAVCGANVVRQYKSIRARGGCPECVAHASLSLVFALQPVSRDYGIAVGPGCRVSDGS